MRAPCLITFEGPEGGGKTTQIALLAAMLRERGDDVLTTRQPGGESLGLQLRSILLDACREAVHPRTELLLMMADRAQNVERVIRPHLEAGGIVLCDRYTDSSIAYQGHGRGIDLSWIDSLNAYATNGLQPDLTLLLDIDPRLGLARQTERTRMEMEDLDFHARVRAGFLEQAARFPERIWVIDASRSRDGVSLAIAAALEASA